MKQLQALCLLLLAVLARPGLAAGLPEPTAPVVLTVSGKIGVTNGDKTARFDLPMLEALPRRVSAIETPWYKSKTSFEGPLGSELLKAVGAAGKTMKVTALNDYAVEIPTEDFTKWPVILATRIDGKPISVREKGPIFVIYPFDREPSLYNELYFGRSIWQVKSIEIY